MAEALGSCPLDGQSLKGHWKVIERSLKGHWKVVGRSLEGRWGDFREFRQSDPRGSAKLNASEDPGKSLEILGNSTEIPPKFHQNSIKIPSKFPQNSLKIPIKFLPQ